MQTVGIFKDLNNSEQNFELSNVDENHAPFSDVHISVIGKNELETSKSLWIDKMCILRTKNIHFWVQMTKKSKQIKKKENAVTDENEIKDFKFCLMGQGEMKK